jgi:hypothetical protein
MTVISLLFAFYGKPFSAENVALHLLPEAAATQERRLEAVRCSTWFGAGVTATRGRPPPPTVMPPYTVG